MQPCCAQGERECRLVGEAPHVFKMPRRHFLARCFLPRRQRSWASRCLLFCHLPQPGPMMHARLAAGLQATSLLYAAVCKWRMKQRLGLPVSSDSTTGPEEDREGQFRRRQHGMGGEVARLICHQVRCQTAVNDVVMLQNNR